MKRLITTALTSAFLLFGATKSSALAVLYNGSAGNSPTAQGWSRPSPLGSESFSGGGTVLNTNGTGTTFGIMDGYGRTLSSTPLNATTGFNLRFDLRLLDEARSSSASNNTGTDTTDDRAGLSILVVSSVASRAIELGFWTNRIWAQQDGPVKADPTSASTGTRFTQAEGVSFDTQSQVNRYDLTFLGSNYFLYVNGNYGTPLLTGRLRDYTPEATAFPLAGAVYGVPNTVFIGDNTTSARGSFQLNRVEYSPTPVPFAFNPLLGFGMVGLSRLRKVIFKRAKRLEN